MNTIHSVSNTSLVRSSEAVAVRKSFSFRSWMMRVMLVMMIVVGGKVAWGQTVTYTIATTSTVSTSGTAPVGSSATYSQTYNTAGQMTGGNSTTLTLSGYEGITITGITLSMRSNSSAGAGNFSMEAGSTTLSSISTAKFNTSSWYGSWSTSYVNIYPTISTSYEIQSNEDVVITINATANSLYIASYTITYMNPYLVTFDEEGGSCSTSSIYGSSIILPSASPSNECALQGWEFAGWSTSTQSETTTPIILYKEGTIFKPTAACTLHAVYKQPTGGNNITGNLNVTISNFTEITTSYTTIYTHRYSVEGMDMDIAAYGVYRNASGIQMNTGKGTYIKNLNAFPGRITNITLGWTATGRNSPTLYVDNNNIATNISHSLGRQSNSVTTQSVDVDGSYNYFYFDGTTVTGACYLSSMTINYEYEPCTYNSNPICAPITCLAPTPSSVSDISQNLATLNWSDDNGNSWEYYCSTENTTPIDDGDQTNYMYANLTNLEANTTYFWWVRTVCGEDDKSTWAYGGSFTTLSYTLDAFSSNETLGTISINGYVITGSPEECSKYGSPAYTVIEGTADVSKDGNRFTVTPTSNCTVRINFVEKERYTVNWYVNGEILSNYSNEYCEGATIANADVPDNPGVPSLCGEKDFIGWAEEEFEEIDEPSVTIKSRILIVGNTVTVNKTYYAVFANRNGNDVVYQRVTSAPTNWEGKYLIAYNNDNFMDGSKAGGTSTGQIGAGGAQVDPDDELDIDNDEINASWGDAHCLEVVAIDETYYVLKTLTNNYIYINGNNTGLNSTSDLGIASRDNNKLSINFNNIGDIRISNTSSSVLRYNLANDGMFRFYKNCGQNPIYLYKRANGGYTYSDYTTFCPCAFDTDGIEGDNNFIWTGKNVGDDWGLTSNWVVYNSSEPEYHLAANEPTNSTKVFIINSTDCNIVTPTVAEDAICGNFTINGFNIDIAENKNLTINGTATFTNGIINGNVVFGEDATVSGASASSYVDGIVTKSGSANGFTFPTGSNGNLGKVEVTDGSATNVSVQYFSNPAGFGTNDLPRWWASASVSGFDHVSNVEYWKISSNEAITANFVAEASTDMHFNSETAEEDRIPANIQMAFYDNNRWTNVGGSASIDGNTLTINGAEIPASATRGISGNYTTFGSKSKSTVLPIELVSFTANCNGRSSLVEWTTATEKNNDFFVLERSTDAVNFKEIARIAGAGNSIEPISYAYTDYGVRSGDNYYRLVQVDYDGTSTASEIIVANCLGTDGEPEVLAYPNPFGDDLTLRFENFGNTPATIEVYDMLGRLVQTQKVNCSQNDYEVVLRLVGLSDGTYNVRISTADFVINRKVVKE
ncbi:MAG: T9SS type A sorting domain-containing protein [Bacteroidales bacterium]|nr:T9SS type A sorting domain-containing protein [Bacteroidales bacterium]